MKLREELQMKAIPGRGNIAKKPTEKLLEFSAGFSGVQKGLSATNLISLYMILCEKARKTIHLKVIFRKLEDMKVTYLGGKYMFMLNL